MFIFAQAGGERHEKGACWCAVVTVKKAIPGPQLHVEEAGEESAHPSKGYNF